MSFFGIRHVKGGVNPFTDDYNSFDHKYKNYYERNKFRISQRQKEKITCECGKTITRGTLSSHRKTKIHKTLLQLKNLSSAPKGNVIAGHQSSQVLSVLELGEALPSSVLGFVSLSSEEQEQEQEQASYVLLE